SPPPAFPVPASGLRSEGKALVIAELGPASAPAFRRRTKRKPPTNPASNNPPPAMYIQLSARSSIQSRGGGAAFLGAAFTSVVFGASFFGSVFAGSAGLGASATFGGSGAF